MFLGVDRHGCVAAFSARPDNAAHSMDTDWYAVDRQGHVARLSSGEEGAVPWDAHQQYWYDLFAELALARIEALPAPTPDAARRILGPDLRALDPGALPFQWDGVLEFVDREMLALFRAEFWHAEWRVLDGRPTVVVRDVLQVAFDEYWSAGAIVGAYVLGQPVSPRALGLFAYDCSFSGPYHRTAVPAEPLRIDTLPAQLRDRLGALRLDRLDFGQAPEIDPERFARCRTW